MKETGAEDILGMFSDNMHENQRIVKKKILLKYIAMEVYYARDNHKTLNFEETETVVLMKNNRKMLRVKCVVCGITKTRFLARN